MANLTKAQKELLILLKTEGESGRYTELDARENRTARALERKGLVKLQTWGEPGFEVLAAQVVTQEPAPKKVPAVRKPGSNWKTMNDRYWVSPSKYGQRYCCKHCGKRALGIAFGNPVHNHWNTCPVRVEFEKKAAEENK